MMDQIHIAWNHFSDFIRSNSSILFFCFVGILLAAAIYSTGSVVVTSLNESGRSTAVSPVQKFDQKTIEDVKNLRLSTDEGYGTVKLPASRPNPLAE